MMRQVWAVAWFEFKMHWRRRALLVVTLSVAALIGMILVIVSSNDTRQQLSSGTTQELLDIVPFFWIALYFCLLVLYGPIMADVVPLDRHYGVRELLESLPLSDAAYLCGKLCGMALALASGLLISVALIGIGGLLVYGAVDISRLLRMFLIGALPVVVLNGGLTLLLSAAQPTRRRAAAIGAGVAILCIFLFANAVTAILAQNANTLLDSLNPARPAILRFFIVATAQDDVLLAPVRNDLLVTLVMGGVQLAVVGAAVWGWIRWKAGRA